MSFLQDIGFIEKKEIDCVKKMYVENRMTEYDDYRKLSSQYTNYLVYYGLIKRSKGYSVDHMYSVKQGFIDVIDCRIINNIKNLRVIKKSENSKKSSCSCITKNELLRFPKDNIWDSFIKNEHPLYPGYFITNYNSEKRYYCKSGFIADDWNKDGIPRLLVIDDSEMKSCFSLTVSSLSKLLHIDLQKPFIIKICQYTTKQETIGFYKDFIQV